MTTWTKPLSGFLSTLLCASLLVTLAPAGTAAASNEAKAGETKTVVHPVRVDMKTSETPSGEGTSYYCAVGAFVPFDDIQGWVPSTVTVQYFGEPWSEIVGGAPYDDEASINGIAFPPVGGRHQVQLGDFSYGQGGLPSVVDVTCPEMKAKLISFYSSTATITYSRDTTDVSGKCAKAQAKFQEAVAKVRAIQRKITKLNKQIKQLNAEIEEAENAGKKGKARSLTKERNSKQQAQSKQRRKLSDANLDRARAGSAAAKACRD